MATRGRLRERWRKNRREWLTFAAFVAPNAVLFAAFTYWPIVYGAWLSLVSWELPSRSREFVGLANYRELFADEWFWKVLLNTLVYSVTVVVAAQVLAFALALLLNRKVIGRALFRTVAFTPHVTTTAAAALVWVLLLDPKLGPLSFVYNIAGVEGPHWLASTSLALGAIMVVGIWREIGFASLFFLSGLQGLPTECYEAAKLDGTSRWAIFRHITAPLMSPVIFFLMVSGLIASVKIFDTVAIMTEGGPIYPSSSTFVYHLYQLGFRDYRLGYASGFAMVFFAIMFVITFIQLRLSRRWVHYGD